MSSALPISKVVQNAVPLIRSKLASQPLPLLTKKQFDQSLELIQTFNKPDDFLEAQQKKAAVLVPIIDIASKGPSLVFTVRSSRLGSHALEIAFPGGHMDHQVDGNCLYHTALREAEEELRSDEDSTLRPHYDLKNDIEILGATSSIPSMKGVMVTPVVAAFRHTFPDDHTVCNVYFPGNRSEVSKVFTMSIQELLTVESSEPLRRMGNGNFGPIFKTAKYGKIWGLTAIVLRPILHQILKPFLVPH